MAEMCVHVCVRHVLLYLHAMYTFRPAFLLLSGGPRLDLTPFSSRQLQLRRPPSSVSAPGPQPHRTCAGLVLRRLMHPTLQRHTLHKAPQPPVFQSSNEVLASMTRGDQAAKMGSGKCWSQKQVTDSTQNLRGGQAATCKQSHRRTLFHAKCWKTTLSYNSKYWIKQKIDFLEINFFFFFVTGICV